MNYGWKFMTLCACTTAFLSKFYLFIFYYGEINNNTRIVGDFNIALTPMDRSAKQENNKETQTLNDTIHQLDLTDIYRTFHTKTMNFTFFTSAHRTRSRIDHILDHKSTLGKLKKT